MRFLGYLVGLAVFLFILFNIDVAETARILVSARLFYVFLAVLLVFPVLGLECLRWQFIMRRVGMDYGFRECFVMFASSLYIGFVTPARVGEFVRVSFLRRHGLGRPFFSVFVDRFSDALLLMGLGYVGLLVFAGSFGQQVFWLSAAIVLGLCLLAVAFFRRDLVRSGLRFVFNRVVPERLRPELKAAFYEFYGSFPRILDVWSLFFIFVTTFVSWIAYSLQVFLLAWALGIDVPFFGVVTALSAAGILSILPISISGIGTRDAAFVFFFGLLGVRSEFSVALSTLVLGLMVLVAVLCFPFWLRMPADLSFFKNNQDSNGKH